MTQIVEVNTLPGEDIGASGSVELSIHAFADDIWWICSSTVT